MSPRLLPPLPRRATRALAAVMAAAGLGLAAAPAHAVTVSYSGTDPKGDGVGPSGLDFVSAEASYDKSTGFFTLTTETVSPMAASNGGFGAFFGTTTDGVCQYDPTQTEQIVLKPAVTFAYAAFQTTLPPIYTYTARSEDDTPAQTADIKTVGNRVTLASKPDATLKDLPLDCFYMFGAIDRDGTGVLTDSMTGPLAEPTSGSTPSTPKPGSTPGSPTPKTDPIRAPLVVATTDPDGDRDGTPDSRDACPTVPGAAKNGCATMKPADEIRLGAKRVVVDRLVPRTAAGCPARVRIKVLAKGRTIGSTVVAVDQYGSFCRVAGIVKLKKRVSRVRVTAKAAGMGSTAKSVRR